MQWALASSAGREDEVGRFGSSLQEVIGALHNIPPAQRRGRAARPCMVFFSA